MPTRGSLAAVDLAVAATATGIEVALLAATGGDVVFGGDGPDGDEPIELIAQGKFW